MNTKIEKAETTSVFFQRQKCECLKRAWKHDFTIKPKRKRSGNGSGLCVTLTRLEKLCGTLTDKAFREKLEKVKNIRFIVFLT